MTHCPMRHPSNDRNFDLAEMIRFSRELLSCLGLGLLASFAVVTAPAQTAQAQVFAPTGYSGDANPLQTLPPIQAIPITPTISGTGGGATDALTSPGYCDVAVLQRSATIRAIRFRGRNHGVAVGDHGSIKVTGDGGQTWSQVVSGVQCRLNDAIWVDGERVVAVGGGADPVTRISRGVVLFSADQGKTWKRSSDSELPLLHTISNTADESSSSAVRQRHSLTALGDADPITGASVFQSRDFGRSWQSLLEEGTPTVTDAIDNPIERTSNPRRVSADESAKWSDLVGTRSVIRTSCRLDQQTVMCAGDHGNIFQSADDGKTWNAVHGDNGSCGVLVVAGNVDRIPWALIGRECLEKRLRTNVVVGSAGGLTPGSVSQAAMQLGAAAVDFFPSADADKSVVSLRRWIDVHHPPIVAIDAALELETKAALLQHSVSRGAEKVVEYSRDGRGEMLLHDSAMLPGCGVLAGDFSDDSQLLVSDFGFRASGSPNNPWVAINSRYSGGTQVTRGDSLGIGVRLTSGHRLPPRESKASRRRLQVIQGRLKQQAAIADLHQLVDGATRGGEENQFVDALRRLLDQTSRIDQFRSAWSIAAESIGTINQAAVWDEISNRFAASTAGQLAGLHARARRASLEWERHRGLIFRLGRTDTGMEVPLSRSDAVLDDASRELFPTGGGHAAMVSPFQTNDNVDQSSQSSVIQASASLPLQMGRGFNLVYPTATPPRREVDLAWQMHPVRLIVEDAIARNNGRSVKPTDSEQTDDEPTDSEQTTSTEVAEALRDESTEDLSADLRRIADRQTLWSGLLQPESLQTATAVRADVPPRLDGVLNDVCWANPLAKAGVTRDSVQTQLRVCWDDQFIYLAIRNSAESLQSAELSEAVGSRDTDLSGADRVSVGFDLDRDLLTAMNIAFTRDGHTHDDLDGFDDWNPTWYLASHESDGAVTTEIAIEQNGLGVIVKERDRWFVQVQTLAAGQSTRYPMMPDPTTRVRVDFR